VILDNRNKEYSSITKEQVAFLCNRRFGIGADGLMLLNATEQFDFEMKYYNSDGAEGSMCGNGGRCLVKFAYHLGIKESKFSFIAVDGPHEARVDELGIVSLKMQDVDEISSNEKDFLLDTGSPHLVRNVTDLSVLDVFSEGRSIRYNQQFASIGVNVNFVELIGNDEIAVRTYERGVEDETYSCGTGVTAAALVNFGQSEGMHHVKVKTKGGSLSVNFETRGFSFNNIWLNGPAEKVFVGRIKL